VDRTWRTTDLGSAAYAHARGLRIAKVDRRDREVEFTFEDPKQIGSALQIEYANSNEARYDESVRVMKKLAFGDRSDRVERTRR
jgi:hypothetical protein